MIGLAFTISLVLLIEIILAGLFLAMVLFGLTYIFCEKHRKILFSRPIFWTLASFAFFFYVLMYIFRFPEDELPVYFIITGFAVIVALGQTVFGVRFARYLRRRVPLSS